MSQSGLSVLQRILTDIHRELPYLALSLALCVCSALPVYFAWRVKYRSGSLFPKPGLRIVILFLSIQILLLVINLIMALTGTDLFPYHLWSLEPERSIPSINSAIQLFVLSSLCFLTGFAPGKASLAERAYWSGLGIGFAAMSMFEYEVISKNLIADESVVLFFLVLAAASLFMFARTNTNNRRLFLLFLLGGLGIWASGAFFFDKLSVGGLVVGPLEETIESLGSIVALFGITGYVTRIAPQARIRQKLLLPNIILTGAVLVVLLLGSLVWEDRENWSLPFIARTLLEEILYARRMDVTIDDTLALTGWTGELPQPGASSKMSLWLYAINLPPHFNFGFSIQLLDQGNGGVIAAADKMSKGKRDTSKWKPGRWHTRSQTVHVSLPADMPTDRAFWLTLSLWEYEGNNALRPLSVNRSDRPLLGDTYIILDEFVLPDPVKNSAGQSGALARFANGFVLQAASIPERAQAGEALEVTFRWGTDSAGSEDLTQFLHFEHDESGLFWNVDQMPMGLRLPTRLWYAGLQASEAWRFTLPADMQPGQYAIYSGLYRLSDMQRLGVTLADGAQPADARIPLGTILIEG